MNAPAPITVPAALQKAVADTGLTADGAKHLLMAFAPHFAAFNELREKAKGIPITAPKAAKLIRLELKAIRVAAEKTRVDLKADSLRRSQAIDGVNAILKVDLVPVEEAMEAIEKAEEIAEAKRKEELHTARMALLQKCGDASPYESLDLGGMESQAWEHLLKGAKLAREAQIKAEADRIAAEKAQAEAKAKRDKEAAEANAKLKAENERLAAIAAKERAAREESERVARLASVEREAKARKEREAADAKAREERQKLQALRDELEAKELAEAKRLADEKAAARKAASAPDKQKLSAMAAAVRTIAVPTLTTDAGIALKAKIAEQVAKFASWLEAEATKL